MTAFVALLRAVNVGGTGKLPMSDLKARRPTVPSRSSSTRHREIYVHYGDGMVDTKLKIPATKNGTARNMNTVAKLAAMASGG